MTVSRLLGAFVVTCLAVPLLSGCFTFGAKPKIVVHTYQLDYDAPEPADASLPVVVQVAPFRIAAAYDRQAIVYRDTRYATNTYFYHRWAARPARMLTDLITRDLARSRRYQAVEQAPGGVAADFMMQAQVEEIEEIPAAAGACTAHLRLGVVVARTHTRGSPVVFQNTYSGDEACPCNAPEALAAAMSRAAATISQQLQADLAEAIAKDLASKHR